ncbi:MAG: hypothetical protein NZ750_05540 [Anaerolineae bacterium]|nr:hypothetical protein [Anaerolineae bacterium]MDW8172912.1 hypothetical protein [Anaerolineae bacterium]
MSMPPITERDKALIADYLADALAPPQRTEVEQRLATEPTFAAEYRAQERLIALLRALPARPAPRSFALSPEQAQAAPRALPAPARPPRVVGWLLASAAAVALLLGGGLLLSINAPRPEPSAQVAAAPTETLSPAPTLTEADAAIMQLLTELQAQEALALASSPAPTLTEADAAIMQLLAEMQLMETQTAAPAVTVQRAMPAQVLPPPPSRSDSPQADTPSAAAPAQASSPQPEMATMRLAEEGVPAAEEGVPDEAQTDLVIMSMAVPSATLIDALPRLLGALLRLLVSFFADVTISP